jgi:toxin-antitoxin system PIN domain toxin
MISFFPDLNVWLALSVADHSHNAEAWKWLNLVPPAAKVVFCRYTQVGLLRLLTNKPVMGDFVLNVSKAWNVYDQWLQDRRVEFYPEPRNIDAAFRMATAPFLTTQASRMIGDCYLLAYAAESGATLVTFDKALLKLAHHNGFSALNPAEQV